jgi:hypothetical protein
MTTTTAATVCVSEPISWLRLEQYALAGGNPRDVAVRDHLASCPACSACLHEIESDVVALPPLAVPERAAPKRRWWTFAVPAGLALAAAAILLLVLRPRDQATATLREQETAVKGVGVLEIGVVRERDGVVRDDLHTFAAGDRWKIVVTCAAQYVVLVDAFVVEQGARTADFPLVPTRIVCGNRIALPGAFTITGNKANQVCVRVATDVYPPRYLGKPGDEGVACVTLQPE